MECKMNQKIETLCNFCTTYSILEVIFWTIGIILVWEVLKWILGGGLHK